MRYVTRHGRRIAVETLPGINAPRRRKKDDQFAKVPLWWAAAAAEATGAPKLLACVDLLYRAFRANGPSFTLPNRWLEERGVNRKVKYQMLCDLEGAGLLTVERRNGKSPRITLVGSPPVP